MLKSKCPPTFSKSILTSRSNASTMVSTGFLKNEMISPIISSFLLTPDVEITAVPHVRQSTHSTSKLKDSPTLPDEVETPLCKGQQG